MEMAFIVVFLFGGMVSMQGLNRIFGRRAVN
jgi:hypothetical protein